MSVQLQLLPDRTTSIGVIERPAADRSQCLLKVGITAGILFAFFLVGGAEAIAHGQNLLGSVAIIVSVGAGGVVAKVVKDLCFRPSPESSRLITP